MHNEPTFTCAYSPKENQEALDIRKKYMPQAETELEALKKLDRKVRRPASVFAYLYGSVSAVIMGSGMSLVMTDIGAMIGLADAMIPGIIIGLAGLGMALTTCPIHRGILRSRKKKYADKILNLSDKIVNG